MKVSDIKTLEFATLSLEKQLEIKNSARPVPDLHLSQIQKQCKGKGEFTRRFDRKVFDKIQWVCGCEESNSLFCFVCLLFGGDDSWTREGVSDLKHLNLKINKHANSKKHKNNFISFQLLGRTDVLASSSTYTEDIVKQYELVEKTRQILSRVIDILKFCGTCNLPLHSQHDEDDSTNKGVFLELIDFTRKIDAAFNSHMEDAHVFKGTSSAKTVQNELLQCMLSVCREHIIKEIRKSSYLSFVVDNTIGTASETRTALVLRYELYGRVNERFWGFLEPEIPDADELAKCILHELELVLDSSLSKLIGQTYDGAVIMGGGERGVNIIIKERYKNAHFVYCYAHQLHDLLVQTACSITSVKIFFANLNGIATFFSQSSDMRAALDYVCDRKPPQVLKIRWKFHSRIIQTVLTYNDAILECLANVQAGVPKMYDSETITLAAGFIHCLEDSTFLFWLHFFSKIMPHIDHLSNELNILKTDSLGISDAVLDFENAIVHVRDGLPAEFDIEKDRIGILLEEPSRKRRRAYDENLNLLAREICDVIVIQIKDRFKFKNHLCGANMFMPDRLDEYKQYGLPVEDINEFCRAYSMIDRSSLMTELEVFYSRPEVTSESMPGCMKMLTFINYFGLDAAFKEITKALKILVTIPMTTLESGRCFSTFKLIKSFLRNAKSEDKSTDLAMLYLEQTMIREIPDFNELVIKKFISEKNKK